MERARTHRYLTTASLLAGLILSGTFGSVTVPLWAEATSAATPPTTPAAQASPDTSLSGIAFLTPKTRLWLDRSQVICFTVKQPVTESRYLGFKVDEKYLHVLIPPTLLPGATLGYLRVRPLTEGHTQVNLEGATIDVDIARDTAASTLEQTRPEIVSPANGAVLWGSFVVGVEQLNLTTAPPRLRPVLRLPDGHEIAAQDVPNQQPGPHLHYAYPIDARALHNGSNQLVAIIKDETGHEIASDPINVTVITPDPAALVSGDCKDQINTQLPPLPLPPPPKVPPATPAAPPPPPKPFVPPAVIADDNKANLGQIVTIPNDNPPWCMPVTVPGKGRYIMIVTARGDLGANALPSIGVSVDRDQNSLSNVRLATTDWQRIPVGRPFTLEDGPHILTVHFRNGFNQGPTDSRHLYLAHYELLRLDPPGAPPPVLADNPGNSMTMQAGAQEMMQAKAPVTATTNAPASAPPATSTTSPASTSPATSKIAAASSAPASAPSAASPTGSASVTMSPATTQSTMMAAATPPAPAPAPPVSAATMAMMQSLPPSGSLQVVFRDPLEGQMIDGQAQINAMCWWPNRDHSPPPTVELLVNDKVVASATTPQPQFRLDVSAFQPGPNKIQLRGSLPTGQHAVTPVETVILPKELAAGNEPYRPSHKYFVYDPAWNGTLLSRTNQSEPDGVATFNTNGDATLLLPGDLQGPYRVSIEARGTDLNGPAVATILLNTNGQETKLGEIPTGAAMAELPVAQTTFAPGPKTLTVRFANEAHENGKGDRNLYVHYVRIEPIHSAAAVASDPPAATIAYPANGAVVGMADAVVANVSGRDGAIHADLLIDGQPQHFNLGPPNGFGPVLFPLLTRGLTPGPHRLQVTALDGDKHTAQSGEVTVTVAAPGQVVDNDYTRALFLLDRFGYGPEPREIAAILTMGRHAWLEARLNETIESPQEQNEEERLHAEFPDQYAAVPRALQYLLTDANPVRARFVMWTENHFSTWVSKDGPPEKAREHDRFLELGVAPFADLLLASATSPAMLIYLDQRNSVAHRLNENYAREIMELHTLGVKGGYTQQDVTTLADLLTGWTLADEAPMDGSNQAVRTFRYDPYLNSGNDCQILGMDFPGVSLDRRFDRVLTALNMLAAHPSCAHFISRKLVEHYVSDPAPPALVDAMARDYMENGGDLRAMLLDLSERPEFWAAAPKVASPIDFAVRLARLARLANPGAINDLASHSGMGMFDRATPDGYPDADGYYASSNALLQRWHFAQAVQTNFVTSGLVPDDWKPADDKWDPATTQKLIDVAAVRITGRVLTDNSNAAALQLIAAVPATAHGQLNLLATFLCQVPETSLR